MKSINKKSVKKQGNKFYIGVDVGGTYIKYGIFDKNKKLLDKFSAKTIYSKRGNERLFINNIFDSIDKYLSSSAYGIKKEEIIGIGFAVPGPVVDNKILKLTNFGFEKKLDLEKAAKRYFGRNVKVLSLNDANAAALGEYNHGMKEKYKSACLITIGTGIGMGIIIDGNIVEGKSGIAGELSHIRVDYSRDAKKCNCGNIGCLETVASANGIEYVYSRMCKVKTHCGIRQVFERAKNGDKIANDAIHKSLGFVSLVIYMLMLVYEPEIIMVGGGVSAAGKIVTDTIKSELKDKVFMTKKLPKIEIAKLKNEAGIYGAVAKL